MKKNQWKLKLDIKNKMISLEVILMEKCLKGKISLELSTTPIGINMKRMLEK